MNARVALPRPTKDMDQAKRDFDEFGYALIQDLVDADTRSALSKRLLSQARAEAKAGVGFFSDAAGEWVGAPKPDQIPPWQIVRNLLNKGELFRQLVLHPQLLEMMRHAFRYTNFPFILSSTSGIITRRGRAAQAIHTDQQMIPHDTPAPYVTNVLLMLTDFTLENGATRVVPGSQVGPMPEWAFKPGADGQSLSSVYNPVEYETIAAEGPAGTALVFDGRLWHGAGASSPSMGADEARLAISTYYGLFCVRQQDNLPASIQPDVYEKMSPELRDLIGFKNDGLGKIDAPTLGGRSNTNRQLPFVTEMDG